jgi:hypothetical protein
MKAVNWVLENWEMILMVSGALVAVASVIVKLTPNKTDDAVVGVLQRILGRLSMLNPRGVGGVKMPLTKPREVEEDGEIFSNLDRK